MRHPEQGKGEPNILTVACQKKSHYTKHRQGSERLLWYEHWQQHVTTSALCSWKIILSCFFFLFFPKEAHFHRSDSTFLLRTRFANLPFHFPLGHLLSTAFMVLCCSCKLSYSLRWYKKQERKARNGTEEGGNEDVLNWWLRSRKCERVVTRDVFMIDGLSSPAVSLQRRESVRLCQDHEIYHTVTRGDEKVTAGQRRT